LTLEELTAKDKDLLRQVSMLPAISRIETPEKKLLVELIAGKDALQMELLKQKLTKLKSGSILITKEEREQVEKVKWVQMRQCCTHGNCAPEPCVSSVCLALHVCKAFT